MKEGGKTLFWVLGYEKGGTDTFFGFEKGGNFFRLLKRGRPGLFWENYRKSRLLLKFKGGLDFFLKLKKKWGHGLFFGGTRTFFGF